MESGNENLTKSELQRSYNILISTLRDNGLLGIQRRDGKETGLASLEHFGLKCSSILDKENEMFRFDLKENTLRVRPVLPLDSVPDAGEDEVDQVAWEEFEISDEGKVIRRVDEWSRDVSSSIPDDSGYILLKVDSKNYPKEYSDRESLEIIRNLQEIADFAASNKK